MREAVPYQDPGRGRVTLACQVSQRREIAQGISGQGVRLIGLPEAFGGGGSQGAGRPARLGLAVPSAITPDLDEVSLDLDV